MFSRQKRLSREEFIIVQKSGKRLSGTHLSILIPTEGKGYAVVVSKKVSKLSIIRHRIKRRILAALRSLPLPPSLIVFPKVSVHSVSYKDIHTELKNLLS